MQAHLLFHKLVSFRLKYSWQDSSYFIPMEVIAPTLGVLFSSWVCTPGFGSGRPPSSLEIQIQMLCFLHPVRGTEIQSVLQLLVCNSEVEIETIWASVCGLWQSTSKDAASIAPETQHLPAGRGLWWGREYIMYTDLLSSDPATDNPWGGRWGRSMVFPLFVQGSRSPVLFYY